MGDIKYITRLLKEYLDGKSPESQKRTERIKGYWGLTAYRKDPKALSLPLPSPDLPPGRVSVRSKHIRADLGTGCDSHSPGYNS